VVSECYGKFTLASGVGGDDEAFWFKVVEDLGDDFGFGEAGVVSVDFL
jgi:hypothetical protein